MLELSIFSQETFQWLEAIHQHPTLSFYLTNRQAFRQFVEQPFQGLMRQAALQLPGFMRDHLETQRGIFSRFPKNDFGQGGAWDHYWGAFYPKGSRRIADAQLAVWLDRQRFHISFYIGPYGLTQRQRFKRNCSKYLDILPSLLRNLVENPRILLTWQGEEEVDTEGSIIAERLMSWEDWLSAPDQGDYLARIPFTSQAVLHIPGSNLVSQVADTLTAYFPLALLTTEEDPIPLIKAFLEINKQ